MIGNYAPAGEPSMSIVNLFKTGGVPFLAVLLHRIRNKARSVRINRIANLRYDVYVDHATDTYMLAFHILPDLQYRYALPRDQFETLPDEDSPALDELASNVAIQLLLTEDAWRDQHQKER